MRQCIDFALLGLASICKYLATAAIIEIGTISKRPVTLFLCCIPRAVQMCITLLCCACDP